MNYTQNHHLPQWEKADRVLMDDFNQAMAQIETGLIGVGDEAAAAAGKAQSTADSALAKANAAQTAANNAQTTANNAYSPSYKPYAAGTYVGNGDTLDIYLGFRPSFAIITRQTPFNITASAAYAQPQTAVAGLTGTMSPTLVFTSSGMTVSSEGYSFPQLNASGTSYSYIAFR